MLVPDLPVSLRPQRGSVTSSGAHESPPSDCRITDSVHTPRSIHIGESDVAPIADHVDEAGLRERSTEESHVTDMDRCLVTVSLLSLALGVGTEQRANRVRIV